MTQNGEPFPKRKLVVYRILSKKVKPLLQNTLGLPIYSNLVNMERLTFFIIANFNQNSGNEKNSEMKWGSFS